MGAMTETPPNVKKYGSNPFIFLISGWCNMASVNSLPAPYALVGVP